MEQVTVFKTSDGTVFDTEVEAQAHEKELANLNQISEWLNTTDLTKASRTRAKNSVVEFLAWSATR